MATTQSAEHTGSHHYSTQQ
ncbi:hypothetical protein A2U01_0092016, partial [Trifolium medium]|nr:hypothetical protein [Trifolium medium]